MIELREVHTRHALRGVSLTIDKGDVVAVIGPSGAGKSTLLRVIMGLEPITQGSVKSAGSVGFCFQDFQLFPHLSVLKNVTLAMELRGVPSPNEKAREVLKRVDCGALEARKPASLSGGQKQRVALARALALEPDGVLLDEPVSALDPECVADVVQECRDLRKSGKAVMVTTHHLPFAKAIANRVIFLVDGKIVEDGTPSELFGAPKTERLRAYLAHLLVTE